MLNVKQRRTYGSHFPSDSKTLLFKCLVVMNILVCRKSHDSSCCLMAKDTWERLKLVKSRPKICINEVDTKIIDLNESNVNRTEPWKLDTTYTLMTISPGFTLGKGMVVFWMTSKSPV